MNGRVRESEERMGNREVIEKGIRVAIDIYPFSSDTDSRT